MMLSWHLFKRIAGVMLEMMAQAIVFRQQKAQFEMEEFSAD
jgi:hypothetical protein